MNAEQHQKAADLWTKPTDLSHWPACRLHVTTFTIVIYYYSAQKLILILCFVLCFMLLILVCFLMYRKSEGSVIQGFDNPILTVMWLGFFHINASSAL